MRGVTDPEQFATQLSDALKRLISPPAAWNVAKEDFGGTEIITVSVPAGPDKPYTAQGTIYLRKGAATYVATSKDVTALIGQRQSFEVRWERNRSGAELDDIDGVEVSRTADLAQEAGRLPAIKLDISLVLRELGLEHQGGITNGAVVLFAKQPALFFPQVRVRFLVYRSGKTGDVIAEDRLFEGNLFRIAEEVTRALTSYGSTVQSAFRSERWEREDFPHYPMAALREGIMNSLVHRDYSSPSGSVRISVKSGALEIWNFGSLPGELRPSDLKRDHPSLPRNPDIAHVCFIRGLMEGIGRGTQKILQECRKLGLRDPQWRTDATGTTLTLFAANKPLRALDTTELNDRQTELLATMQPKKKIRIRDYMSITKGGVTERTARSDLATLVDSGWLIRQGRGRNTTYSRSERKLSDNPDVST